MTLGQPRGQHQRVQRLFIGADLPAMLLGSPRPDVEMPSVTDGQVDSRGVAQDGGVVQRAFEGADLPGNFVGANRQVSPRLGSMGYVYNIPGQQDVGGVTHTIHISVPGILVVPQGRPGYSVHTDFHVTPQRVGGVGGNRHYDENNTFLPVTASGYRSDKY